MEIGECIKSIRQNRKLSRKGLSDISGVSPSYIEEIESGKKTPGIDILHKLSMALNLTVSELIGETESNMSPELKELFDNIKDLPANTINLLNAFIVSLAEGKKPKYVTAQIDDYKVDAIVDAEKYPNGINPEVMKRALEIKKQIDDIKK